MSEIRFYVSNIESSSHEEWVGAMPYAPYAALDPVPDGIIIEVGAKTGYANLVVSKDEARDFALAILKLI